MQGLERDYELASLKTPAVSSGDGTLIAVAIQDLTVGQI